ncbi:MAG: type IV toxin-antitoxin system AbiEi family antitoxin domain-containing protein [Arachnia sp.]
MFTRREVPEALIALAQSQDGVFSTTQAEAAGLTRAVWRRMHRDGQWHPVAPGMSSTAAAPTWTALAWAGVLQCEGGVLGGEAAGHLYGICDEPQVIDVWTPSRRRIADQRWRFRRGTRRGFADPARVRMEDAVLEICAEATAPGIVDVLGRAVGSRRTTAQRLRAAALGAPVAKNRQLVLQILDDVANGVESPLEHRYLVDVERAHGLPVGARQVSISSGTRTDVGYLKFRVLVELDGRVWHEGLAASADMRRDNQHAIASFTTLRFGWHAVVDNPCGVASQVIQALTRGGWPPRARGCPRCP